MNTILKENLREDFYIRLFFNTKNGFYKAGTIRAFLDFSRTLPVKDENRSELKNNAENFLIEELKKLTEKELKSQEEFDIFHRKVSHNLKKIWEELSFGQTQKWINMTLKYWLLFGENRINGIELNAKYFHIPIDSYVQKGMFEEKKPKAWSKISDYETYLQYQNKHRGKKTGNFPIVDEFDFFNFYEPK
ncbi:hypothetical protein [Epilithonimonas hominis]|uniref:hypothetical protein n=1 Tax=Epilithonimonas hominis TaxID=420404 RepID=UPI002899E769|nr:hypothetical protein [Epilithonimonas hominis]